VHPVLLLSAFLSFVVFLELIATVHPLIYCFQKLNTLSHERPLISRMLIQKTDLPLTDILCLDHIQKNLPVPKAAIRHLRRSGLIEGRKPNIHVSKVVAQATASKAEYIRTRAQDDAFYSKLIIDYLTKFGKASREEIDKLLWTKLSDALDKEQKSKKVANLLANLRRSERIDNAGTRKSPIWQLAEKKVK